MSPLSDAYASLVMPTAPMASEARQATMRPACARLIRDPGKLSKPHMEYRLAEGPPGDETQTYSQPSARNRGMKGGRRPKSRRVGYLSSADQGVLILSFDAMPRRANASAASCTDFH